MSLTSLTDLGFKTETVELSGGQTLQVRGASLTDLMKLTRVYGSTVVEVYDKLVPNINSTEDVKEAVDSPESEAGNVLLYLFEVAPDLVCDLIVLCTDTEDTVEGFKIAKRLPIPVQIDALEKIALLTFEENGGVEKTMETVIRMFGGINGLLSKLRASAAGSLESESTSPSSTATDTESPTDGQSGSS